MEFMFSSYVSPCARSRWGRVPNPFTDLQMDRIGLYQILGVKDLAELYRVDRSYQDLMYMVAEELGVPVAEPSSTFADRPELLFGRYDGVHVNPAGAQVIAETIHHKLPELGWVASSESVRSVSARGRRRSADG
jgi:hypothetical protein